MGGVRKGKTFKIYFKENIHERIASNIELISASALLFFDALSGFDTTLSIPGKSKKTFRNAWTFFIRNYKMLVKLESLQQKSEIFKEYIALLEQSFAVLYSATYYTKDVSTCR